MELRDEWGRMIMFRQPVHPQYVSELSLVSLDRSLKITFHWLFVASLQDSFFEINCIQLSDIIIGS